MSLKAVILVGGAQKGRLSTTSEDFSFVGSRREY
jgi:hypothetical protein